MSAKNFDHTSPNHAKGPTHKGGIHLNPNHKGLLHKELGVPQGEKIPVAKIKKAEHAKNPAERKRAVFADNFGHTGS